MSSFVVFWPHRTHCTDTTCCYGRRTYSCVCLCVFVCLFVGHTDELCKNGWTDRDAVWGADSCRPKELCIRWKSRSPHSGEGAIVSPTEKHWESLLRCENGKTARLLQPTAMLPIGRCHNIFLPLKNLPPAIQPFVKTLWHYFGTPHHKVAFSYIVVRSLHR